jgi:proteasome lid subunit RPN8/RPN11
MALKLTTDIYSKITAHLQAAYPNEGAGILLGSGDGDGKTVQAVKPFGNNFEAGEQFHRYLITAEDMLAGEIEAEQLGLDVVGIFHSHPDHPAIASEYDREYALPWYSYLIVSVQNGTATDKKSWLLTDDRTKFNEEAVDIQ